MIQVNRIYLIFNSVHFLVDSSDAKLLIFREIEVIVIVWGHRYIIFCFDHL